MTLITHLAFGLLAITAGIVGLKYNFQLVGITGRLDWIESKLGSGSTYLAYKLLALLLVIGGALYATGLAGSVGNLFLNPIRSLFPH